MGRTSVVHTVTKTSILIYAAADEPHNAAPWTSVWSTPPVIEASRRLRRMPRRRCHTLKFPSFRM
jgi:hypothetical protein